FLVDILIAFFGSVPWLFPFFLILFGVTIQLHHPRSAPILFGLSIFLLSVLALEDLRIPLHTQTPLSSGLLGGGYVGLFFRYPLERIFGFQAALFILTFIMLAAILIIFDTTLPTAVRVTLRFITKPLHFVA